MSDTTNDRIAAKHTDVSKQGPQSQQTLVVHVVDRLSGGVPAAVKAYIRNSPDEIAHLIASPFVKGEPSSTWNGVHAKHENLGEGHAARTLRLRRLVKRLRPQVVHAHSSFSGFYARALPKGKNRNHLIVYTPHCYAFERRDIGLFRRGIFRVAEALLAKNTDIVAGCSAWETQRASRMTLFKGSAIFLPNVTSITLTPPVGESESAPGEGAHETTLRVAGMGRLSRQKDPMYFSNVIQQLKFAGVTVDARWIGDGDPEMRGFLEQNEIRVTGWLEESEVASELRELDLYVHSAAWEGFPIALLDAHSQDVAALARPIDALTALPEALTMTLPPDDLLRALLEQRFDEWSVMNQEKWANYLAENTAAQQTAALRKIWASTPITETARER